MKNTSSHLLIISTISLSGIISSMSYAEDFSLQSERQSRMTSMDQAERHSQFSDMGASGKRNMERISQKKRSGKGNGERQGKARGSKSGGNQYRYGQANETDSDNQYRYGQSDSSASQAGSGGGRRYGGGRY